MASSHRRRSSSKKAKATKQNQQQRAKPKATQPKAAQPAPTRRLRSGGAGTGLSGRNPTIPAYSNSPRAAATRRLIVAGAAPRASASTVIVRCRPRKNARVVGGASRL